MTDATLEDDIPLLPRFAEAEALALGMILVDLARAGNLPVVINIRTANRCLFHAALPGAAALNDLWAQRKSNTALVCGLSSLEVGPRMRARGYSLAANGLDPALHADHGGAIPVRVEGVGMVAVATVSGLPQREDHALVLAALRQLQART